MHEVAEIAGVGPSAVSNWRRRGLGFPEPVFILGEKRPPKRGRKGIGRADMAVEVFDLPAVLDWLESTGRLGAEPLRGGRSR